MKESSISSVIKLDDLTMVKKKDIPIGETRQKLEALVNKLDSDELQLEEALAAFEEGINLTRQAQEILSKAEQRVQLLMERDDGGLHVKPLTDETEE